MLAWLSPLLVFGLVVLVHELGHFIAAKMVGVYTPRFSIGFGKTFWRRRRGETEFVLSVLPLGGYVRMASKEDEAAAFLEGGSDSDPTVERERGPDWDPDAMMPFGPKPVPAHRWFESKPLWARIFILIAGVTMNVVLSLVVSIGVIAGYGREYLPAVVDSVVPGRPAMAAGMLRGDSIVAVGGAAVTKWSDVLQLVGANGASPLDIDVIRSGQRTTLHVKPELVDGRDPVTGAPVKVGRIGAASDTTVLRERPGLRESVVEGWKTTWWMGGAVIRVVGGLFSGDVPLNQLGGPIAIAKSSVDAAKSGLESLLKLLAFLSINVAVLNLLPVPILDGGQILINTLETAKGSAFSARTREYILRAGLVAIALLFALVMFNDLKGLVKLIFDAT